jgi:hypothetical protein
LYILKKIFGIVFASGGTSNEDPKWIRITRVIAIYHNVPKQTLVVPLFLPFVNQLLLAFSDNHIARLNAMYEHISALCLPVTVVHSLKMSKTVL